MRSMVMMAANIHFLDTNVLLTATDKPQDPRAMCSMSLINYESHEKTQT